MLIWNFWEFSTQRKLREEKQALAKKLRLQRDLNMPYLIRSESVFEELEAFYVVQEPYSMTFEGEEIMHLSYPAKLKMLENLVSAVACAHKARIANLGLRPSNIALVKERQMFVPKIIFFHQIVQIEQKSAQTEITQKNVSFFDAPEISQSRICSFSSYIWSLGSVFYFLLFGTVKGIRVLKKDVALDFPAQTPTWLKEILCRMLAYEPSKRYTIPQILDRLRFMKQCEQVAARYIPTSF